MKIYKPTTPARRKMSIVDTSGLAKKEPEKRLIVARKNMAGRSKGQITVRHKGGGEKRFYRKLDFRQTKFDIPSRVEALEYDPNRSAWLALVCYVDGQRSYIIAPDNLKVGAQIISSLGKIEPNKGNRMPLKYIPAGFMVHNIELQPGHGGVLVRSAGSGAVLMTCEKGRAQLKMPSGEIRLVPDTCRASLGQVSNPGWRHIRWGKAGRMRHRGIRPSVRGKAMNPRDHPHGGGEGKHPIGLKHPKTPWGKPALGVKTRKKKKWTSKYIIKRRVKKKRKK